MRLFLDMVQTLKCRKKHFQNLQNLLKHSNKIFKIAFKNILSSFVFKYMVIFQEKEGKKKFPGTQSSVCARPGISPHHAMQDNFMADS